MTASHHRPPQDGRSLMESGDGRFSLAAAEARSRHRDSHQVEGMRSASTWRMESIVEASDYVSLAVRAPREAKVANRRTAPVTQSPQGGSRRVRPISTSN